VSYIYIKKEPKHAKQSKIRLGGLKKKAIAVGFFSIGACFLLSAIFPIVRYQIEYSLKFKQIINPLSSKTYNRNGSILGDMSTDYTQLSNWFVDENSNSDGKGSKFLTSGNATSYYLSIPKLKIDSAQVIIGSMDLKKSLIQYPQTALPGQLGNAVVFGHSVLPQFFNPKSYLTIFSTLYRLNQGDEIKAKFDNVDYTYKVEEMYEVQPTDLSVLEQRFDAKYLTLITCSPPGTYLRRLVIKAKIAAK
jgi:sortase A